MHNFHQELRRMIFSSSLKRGPYYPYSQRRLCSSCGIPLHITPLLLFENAWKIRQWLFNCIFRTFHSERAAWHFETSAYCFVAKYPNSLQAIYSSFVAIINRASKGFILRSSSNLTSIQPSLAPFNSLVRNILKYCSVTWFPFRKCGRLAIEAVQAKLTRSLFLKKNFYHVDYPNSQSPLSATTSHLPWYMYLFKLGNWLVNSATSSYYLPYHT